MVPGVWSHPVQAQGTQKWAKWQNPRQENQDGHSCSYCTVRGQPQYEENLKDSFASEEDSSLKVTQHCTGSARNTDQQLIGPWLESSEPQDATPPHSQRVGPGITLWLGDTQFTAVTWSLAAPTAPNSMEKIFLWAPRVLGTGRIQFP